LTPSSAALWHWCDAERASFQVKVDNAVAAGAAGVIIMNEGTDSRTDAFSGVLSKGADVPVVGVPYEFGRTLAARAGGSVRLAVDAVSGKRVTRNVLADMGAQYGSRRHERLNRRRRAP